jgi:thymidylate synthase
MQGDSGDLASRTVELLIVLHAQKTVGYGDAWRKRGELLSIFTNLARKYDRLVVALDQGTRSGDERLPDTAGDLCVYAAKYLTWLAEQQSDAFDAVSRGANSGECADDASSDALARVLHALQVGEPVDVATSWTRLKESFGALDSGLVAQAERPDRADTLSWERKVTLAWGIAADAATLLIALASEDAEAWRAWREEIEAFT